MREAAARAALRARRVAAPAAATAGAILERLERRARGHPRAAAADARPAPGDRDRQDAFWLVGGRLVDWGRAAGTAGPAELERAYRSARCGAAGGGGARRARAARRDRRAADHRRRTSHPHPEHSPQLGRCESRRRLSETAALSTSRGDRRQPQPATVEAPGWRLAADQRQRDRAEPRRLERRCSTRPTTRPSKRAPRRCSTGAEQPQAAQLPVGLAAVVQPRHRLLTDVAALGERHRALVEPGLLRDDRVVEVDPVARPAALDPQAFGRGLGDRNGARVLQGRPQRVELGCVAQQVDARRRCGSRATLDAADRTSGDVRRARASGSRGARTRAASGPISDSSPRSSVRLCSSTS